MKCWLYQPIPYGECREVLWLQPLHLAFWTIHTKQGLDFLIFVVISLFGCTVSIPVSTAWLCSSCNACCPSTGPKLCGFCCDIRGDTRVKAFEGAAVACEHGHGAGRGSAVTGHRPAGHQRGDGMAAVALSCFGQWVCSFQTIPKNAVDLVSQDQQGTRPT